MDIKRELVVKLKSLLRQSREIFSLMPDKDDEATIVQTIRDEVEFKGSRIWVLICAIFIASLGLNVNSTAVIIGAMLISPLMNPIVGLGLGLAIYDMELVRKSAKSLGIMVLISITTATLYFVVSPLSQAQSELLARTQPTIYDVLIAITGGVAGILANSTKIKGNIIMGVAIATALMPPLCTAGYGLSQGSLSYFAGASYLFIINTIFIAVSTLAIVKLMQFTPVAFVSAERERKTHRWIIGIIICVVTPSVYTGFTLVHSSIQEDAVNRFVRDELNIRGHQALKYSLVKTDSLIYLDVALLGRKVDSLELDSLRQIMHTRYPLKDVALVLRQDFMTSNDSSDLLLSREILMKQLYSKQEEFLIKQQSERDSLLNLLDQTQRSRKELKAIEVELLALFPEIEVCRLADISMNGRSIYLLGYQAGQSFAPKEQDRIRAWLSTRLMVDELAFLRL